MSTLGETSDQAVLDCIRRSGSASVSELVAESGVTATAVRQRLNRLMAQGLIEREMERQARGRPNHRYWLTKKGMRQAGTNYADLALVLWEEIRAIADPHVRRGLLNRIADRLAEYYKNSVRGDTISDRLASVADLLHDRDLPFEVDNSGDLPVLTALACPYPDLAEKDRTVCAMEKMVLSQLIGDRVRLTTCRLDGGSCCTFQTTGDYRATGT